MKRLAPSIAVFLLPLGVLGGFGVAGVVLYALSRWRYLFRLSLEPLYFALPFALLAVIAAAIGPDPKTSLLPALGVALLMTVGLQAARLLVDLNDPEELISAFVIGTSLLAVSVVVDLFHRPNPLPSGLFRDPALHNWAGAFFAMGFPLALHLVCGPRRSSALRAIGVTGILGNAIGLGVSLSWVGTIGAVAGGIAFAVLSSRRACLFRIAVVMLVVVYATFVLWRMDSGGDLLVRGYSAGDVVDAFRGRVEILLDVAVHSAARPVLGWGYGTTGLAQLRQPTAAFAEYAYGHFHNLFAQVLFETGVLGLSALLLLIAYLGSHPARYAVSATSAALIGLMVAEVFDYSALQNVATGMSALILVAPRSTGQLPGVARAPRVTWRTLTEFAVVVGVLATAYTFTAPSFLRSLQAGSDETLVLAAANPMTLGNRYSVWGLVNGLHGNYRLILRVCDESCVIVSRKELRDVDSWIGHFTEIHATEDRLDLQLFLIRDVAGPLRLSILAAYAFERVTTH